MGRLSDLAGTIREAESERDSLDGAEETENLFFEVSKVVESREMLDPWVGWFQQLDIPCVIEKRRHGYILWRKGVETGGTEATTLSELKERKLISFFGFEDEIRKMA
jgi:hypothetical protein